MAVVLCLSSVYLLTRREATQVEVESAVAA